MTMEELLSLKWNNHRSTFLHILTILRDKQLYTDATLACSGKFYSVHKLVLSTCSDYFSAIFDRTTCKNPIIVLKDIKCEDLEALLDYMYLGEVNVRQADLASLIKAAECLQVKGLAVPDDEPPRRTGNVRRTSDGLSSPPAKRKRKEGEDGRDEVRLSSEKSSSNAPRPKSPTQNRLSPQESSSEPSLSNNTAQLPSPDNAQDTPNQVYVKQEMDEADTAGDSYNLSNDNFKEENDANELGELNSDLPEFLQGNSSDSYPPSFAGPSFQPDVNWQGDQNISGNFSGLGFGSNPSQEGSQNSSGKAMAAGMIEALACLYCGKAIAGRNRRQRLKYHLMTHTQERHYACHLCGYKAQLKFTLNRHMRTVHKDKFASTNATHSTNINTSSISNQRTNINSAICNTSSNSNNVNIGTSNICNVASNSCVATPDISIVSPHIHTPLDQHLLH